MNEAKNCLITGGAGFIGSHFARRRAKHFPRSQTVVLDALTYAGNVRNLDALITLRNFHFVHGNICDQQLVEELLARFEIGLLVHLAAESHVDRSIDAPDAFIETNIKGTHSLLKAALAVWRDNDIDECRFHHVSTDEVYGSLGPDDPPFTEDHPYAPNSPYAASKAAADHLVRAYWKTYRLPVTISNCSNNYGPFQYPEKLIPLFLSHALHGKPLPLYGDGRQVRDWLYVEDHCLALEMIVDNAPTGSVYNIGGECEVENRQLIEQLCTAVDAAFALDRELAERFPDAPPATQGRCIELLERVEDRPGHDRRYAMSGLRIRNQLGFRPETGLEQGLAATVGWYLANADWWNPAAK